MRTDDLIEEFEDETELPATWSNGGMGGYTNEYTEWLQQQVVNENDLSQRVNGCFLSDDIKKELKNKYRNTFYRYWHKSHECSYEFEVKDLVEFINNIVNNR